MLGRDATTHQIGVDGWRVDQQILDQLVKFWWLVKLLVNSSISWSNFVKFLVNHQLVDELNQQNWVNERKYEWNETFCWSTLLIKKTMNNIIWPTHQIFVDEVDQLFCWSTVNSSWCMSSYFVKFLAKKHFWRDLTKSRQKVFCYLATKHKNFVLFDQKNLSQV